MKKLLTLALLAVLSGCDCRASSGGAGEESDAAFKKKAHDNVMNTIRPKITHDP